MNDHCKSLKVVVKHKLNMIVFVVRLYELQRKTDYLRNQRNEIEVQIRAQQVLYEEASKVKKEIQGKKMEIKRKMIQIERQRSKIETLKKDVVGKVLRMWPLIINII